MASIEIAATALRKATRMMNSTDERLLFPVMSRVSSWGVDPCSE
jgi:hypothetical protein